VVTAEREGATDVIITDNGEFSNEFVDLEGGDEAAKKKKLELAQMPNYPESIFTEE